MERPASAFFYTARAFGINNTVISLTEQPQLDWGGRLMYITAKSEKRRTELYVMDLVWLLARKYYDISTPQPSKIETEHNPQDRRSGSQIKKDLLKKLKG